MKISNWNVFEILINWTSNLFGTHFLPTHCDNGGSVVINCALFTSNKGLFFGKRGLHQRTFHTKTTLRCSITFRVNIAKTARIYWVEFESVCDLVRMVFKVRRDDLVIIATYKWWFAAGKVHQEQRTLFERKQISQSILLNSIARKCQKLVKSLKTNREGILFHWSKVIASTEMAGFSIFAVITKS